MKKNRAPLIISFLILIGDQISKYLFGGNFQIGITLEFKYLFFISVTFLLMISLFKSKKFSTMERWGLWTLISGIVGNMINITNIIRGYSIADLMVAISVVIVLLSIIIKDRSFK